MTLEDELILPEQFHQPRVSTGLHRLAAAVMEDAFRCLDRRVVTCRPGTYGERIRDQAKVEARHWFESDTTSWPLSFVSCCELLGLDPGAVRRRLGVSIRPLRMPGAPPRIVATDRRLEMKVGTRVQLRPRRVA